MGDWKIQHKRVMVNFLRFINKESNDFILKGETSLMLCYNLDRFSEDIDLNGFSDNFFDLVSSFCKKYNGIESREAKNTELVKRAFLHYGGKKPLKVEVSYREKFKGESYSTINDILVYNIEKILSMKLSAFNGRDKIRDLYDIAFIYEKYKGVLSESIIDNLRESVAYKGIEQFDYLIENQKDELISEDLLLERFLRMYDDLGLR